MANPEAPSSDSSVEVFRDDRDPDLAEWRRIWESDARISLSSRPGLFGRLLQGLKRILRPLVRAPQGDLWERQRLYNLALQEGLEGLQDSNQSIWQLGQDLQRIQGELAADLARVQEALGRDLARTQESVMESLLEFIRAHDSFLDSHDTRIERVERFNSEGLDEVMQHTEAVVALLDQKLDRYRSEGKLLKDRLTGLLATAEADEDQSLVRAAGEQRYVEFEGLFRGTEDEIEVRLARYVEYLQNRGEVLDLGCGRGEALEVFGRAGIPCRGIDSSRAMVEVCHEKGLTAKHSDLFGELKETDEESLGGVISFHVIEHLPPAALEELVHRAWRVLKPGGVLILETPNPLSLTVAASNFWLDPTHVRPVHPGALKQLYRAAGFESVEHLQLQPFGGDSRLPEVRVDELPEEQRQLGENINQLRDRLDDLLLGYQDYAMIGFKPAAS